MKLETHNCMQEWRDTVDFWSHHHNSDPVPNFVVAMTRCVIIVYYEQKYYFVIND